MEFQFKKIHQLEIRKTQCNQLLIKHPGKIAVVVEKAPNCKLKDYQQKFLVSEEDTVAAILLKIKAKLEMDEKEALFLTANGKFQITGSDSVKEVYEKYKDKEDNFLYLAYMSEQVWGV